MHARTAGATSRPILIGTEAQLFVADVAVSCAFYAGKLGFTVAFTYGEPPSYAQVARDGARLNLRHIDEPVFVPGVREREGLLSATLTLASAAEIKQLFDAYQAAGVTFNQPLKRESWGATTFVVEDLDGNLILFAGPAY
jgi:catechol 2,3-dioxygenase-like lactoylglutathione lyase family enzyme